MELTSLRKITSQKIFSLQGIKKVKRLTHIRSVPSYANDLFRNASQSKIQPTQNKEDNAPIKLKRIKTQQNLKPATFTAVKTARERQRFQWTKKAKQLQTVPNKSLTKSTNFRSPEQRQSQSKKKLRINSGKQINSIAKIYSNILKRVQVVMQEYQLKIDKCLDEKNNIARQNQKLKTQIENLNKRYRKSQQYFQR